MLLFSLPFIFFGYLIIQLCFLVAAKIKPKLLAAPNKNDQIRSSEETILDKIFDSLSFSIIIFYVIFFIGAIVFIFDSRSEVPFSASEAFNNIINAEIACSVGIFSFVAIYTSFKQNSFGLLTIEEILEKRHYPFLLRVFFVLNFGSVICYSIDNKSQIGSILGYTLGLSSFIPAMCIIAFSIPFLVSKQKIMHEQNKELYLQFYYSEMYQKNFWKILKKSLILNSFHDLMKECLRQYKKIEGIKEVQYIELDTDESLASKYNIEAVKWILILIVLGIGVIVFLSYLGGLPENYMSILMIALSILAVNIAFCFTETIEIMNHRLIYGNGGFEFINKKGKKCFVGLSSMFLIEPSMKNYIKINLGILVLYINILIFKKEKNINNILNEMLSICNESEFQKERYKTIPIVILMHFLKDKKYQQEKVYQEYFNDLNNKKIIDEFKMNAFFCTALLKKLQCNPLFGLFVEENLELEEENIQEAFEHYIELENREDQINQ